MNIKDKVFDLFMEEGYSPNCVLVPTQTYDAFVQDHSKYYKDVFIGNLHLIVNRKTHKVTVKIERENHA